MTRYRLEVPWGEPAREFTSKAAALRYCRDKGFGRFGWGRVYASHWYQDDYGLACSLYSSRRERDNDDTGAHAVRLTRLSGDH